MSASSVSATGDSSRVDGAALSVVIASWSGRDHLIRCLESLEPQLGPAEVIVALNFPFASTEGIRQRFPHARFLQAPPGTSVFHLRAMGAAATTRQLIALIEDHVTVGPNWVGALADAHRRGHGIVGGPVDNGLRQRAFDWALFFCEYGVHMPPVPEGPVGLVSGVNVAYDRDLLAQCRLIWQESFQEHEINDALKPAGHEPYMIPDAWVASHLPMSLSEAMEHLFTGGRHFARYRASQSSPLKRLLWIAASPAVPLVLFSRITRRVAARNPAQLRHLVRGLGYFTLVLGAWSVGEIAGYLGAMRTGPTRARAS